MGVSQGLVALSSFFGHIAQYEQNLANLNAQIEYRNKLAVYQNNREIREKAFIEQSARDQTSALLERADQSRDQAFLQIQRAQRSARGAAARNNVSRDGNVGNSIRLILNESEKAEAEYTDIIFSNYKNTVGQINREIRGVDARSRSAFYAAEAAPLAPINANIGSPGSIGGLALGLGSAGISSYAWYLANNTPNTGDVTG